MSKERERCDECGDFRYCNEDGICSDCEQDELDRYYEELEDEEEEELEDSLDEDDV